MIKVVDMDLSHIESIDEINNLCFEKPWSKNLLKEDISSKNVFYMCALFDEKVIGYVGIKKILDEGHIMNIAVHPEYQGLSMGKYLMKEIIEKAKDNNIKKITLEVDKDNEVAQNLYKKFGFISFGERKNYYQKNKSAIIMWKYDF